MILDGDFSRLDTVVALAAARGLRLLITFNDDGDPDLRRVAHVEALVAAHLAGNPAIFGYDLRNEPEPGRYRRRHLSQPARRCRCSRRRSSRLTTST